MERLIKIIIYTNPKIGLGIESFFKDMVSLGICDDIPFKQQLLEFKQQSAGGNFHHLMFKKESLQLLEISGIIKRFDKSKEAIWADYVGNN